MREEISRGIRISSLRCLREVSMGKVIDRRAQENTLAVIEERMREICEELEFLRDISTEMIDVYKLRQQIEENQDPNPDSNVRKLPLRARQSSKRG